MPAKSGSAGMEDRWKQWTCQPVDGGHCSRSDPDIGTLTAYRGPQETLVKFLSDTKLELVGAGYHAAIYGDVSGFKQDQLPTRHHKCGLYGTSHYHDVIMMSNKLSSSFGPAGSDIGLLRCYAMGVRISMLSARLMLVSTTVMGALRQRGGELSIDGTTTGAGTVLNIKDNPGSQV